MYLALSEHTAPLGGIHDVFVKDAVGEYRSSCKGRIMPSTFFDAQTQNCIFSGEFLQRYKRWMGVSASGWQVRAYGIRTPSWGVEWDWRALAAKPEALPSRYTDKRRNTGLKSLVQVEQVLSAASNCPYGAGWGLMLVSFTQSSLSSWQQCRHSQLSLLLGPGNRGGDNLSTKGQTKLQFGLWQY